MSMDMTPGRWLLFYTGSEWRPFEVEVRQIGKATAKQIKFAGTRYPRICQIDRAIATFADELIAWDMAHKVAGHSGEFERRRNAAQKDCADRTAAARLATTKAIDALLAKDPTQ